MEIQILRIFKLYFIVYLLFSPLSMIDLSSCTAYMFIALFIKDYTCNQSFASPFNKHYINLLCENNIKCNYVAHGALMSSPKRAYIKLSNPPFKSPL